MVQLLGSIFGTGSVLVWVWLSYGCLSAGLKDPSGQIGTLIFGLAIFGIPVLLAIWSLVIIPFFDNRNERLEREAKEKQEREVLAEQARVKKLEEERKRAEYLARKKRIEEEERKDREATIAARNKLPPLPEWLEKKAH